MIWQKIGVIAGIGILAVTSTPGYAAPADSVRNSQWYLRDLEMSEAHSITTGKGVVVAVVDSGTYPHPDLNHNLLTGKDETGSGDGKVDSVGHGTGMASLIAAHGRSSNGIIGIAPSSQILPIRISRSGKNIDANAMAKGITWATNHGASVINVSAGAGPAFALQDAVAAAVGRDIVVVAAAGNASSEVAIGYPAAIDGVLAVGTSGQDGEHSSTSANDAKIQICAPGIDIITALPTAKYTISNGTSNSTAIVSGAAALVRAKFPHLSAKGVIHRLTATADDIGPVGRDDECGFGRLNIVKALTADVPPLAGGGSASPGKSVGATAVPSAVRPEFFTPSGVPRAEAESAGDGSAWVFGGFAGLVGLGGVLIALGLRRRRRR